MPIRPAHLATMSATIAGTLAGASSAPERNRQVTLTYESGHQQTVDSGGCRTLSAAQGGVVALDAEASATYALFAGEACQGSRVIASGRGSTRFGTPLLAGAIVVG